MAYCLRSLVQILEQVMHPDKHYKKWVLGPAKIPQIQSLLEYATFLRDFFDTTSPLILHTMESLEDQIMEAAGKAEDAIESYITEQILLNPEGQNFMISPPDLGEVLRVFEVTKKEAIKVKAAGHRWGDVSVHVSSTRYPVSSDLVVGVKEDLNQLRSRLLTRASERSIIPIVGTGGLGKTTLARILYEEHSSGRSSHFECCAWVTVSQTYDPNQILQRLIDLIAKPLNGKPQQENDGLIGTLHKTLFRRRYLIVLDDIWSCKAWDDFQRAFPQDNNRSRIILTTRENIVANYVNSNSHQMHILNEDDSWELLCGKVFGEYSCPHELEEVGKTIALSCGGLPLALQVIGGFLLQSEKSKDFWEHVAYNVSSFIVKTDDQFSQIFSWSFVNLPHYLKPCFLYMGAFPEDHVIQASEITKMWVAEGFLYPVADKSLEEVVEIHLNALVDRNLIFVRKKKSNGKAKSYGIHDLMRDLCLRKAREKKFIYFKDSETDILQEDVLHLRRVIVKLSDNEKNEFGSLKLTSIARSFILTGKKESSRFMSHLCFKSSLLRLLCVSASTIVSEFHLDKMFLQLVNLRYLSLWCLEGTLPRSISVLRNLQTLLIYSLSSLMILEELPQLRNLVFKSLEQRSYEGSFSVHENLQCLSCIPLETLVRLLGKLPKLRKLKIDSKKSNDNVDFTCFPKLENLSCIYGCPRRDHVFPETMFAHSIKNLTLAWYNFHQTHLEAIGILPNLQILKFKFLNFPNMVWATSKGGFCQLQYLEFKSVGLKFWHATEIDFPVLRHLVFNKCHHITEIPSDIGVIESLEIIEVDECKTSLFESARRVLEEQSDFGNTLLQLRLGRSLEEEEREGEEEEIKSMVENNALKLNSYTFRSTTILPHSLKRLRLYNCVLSQTSLHAIGILPELEFLKFYECVFENSTWEPFEGEFRVLQCLKITGADLKTWLATEIHFPILRRLVLKYCYRLLEIPNRFGRIETLESLEVDGCFSPLSESGNRILKEQRQLGNTLFQSQTSTCSWLSLIDDDLMADVDGNHLTAFAILGHDGDIWAQSANFPRLKTDELNGIMADFNAPGSLAPHGFFIGGAKYIVIQGDAGAVIRGKKGTGGATIKKTDTALIIGLYDEPVIADPDVEPVSLLEGFNHDLTVVEPGPIGFDRDPFSISEEV